MGAPEPEDAARRQAVVEDAIAREIAARRAEDPLVGARVAAQELLQSAIQAATTDRGAHAESLFAILGALGGFACQMAVRRAPAAGATFAVAETADGRRFFFGDAINAPLLEDRLSLWSLGAGQAQALGATPPDMIEIVRHVSASVGTPGFGIPRIPEGHGPAMLPMDYVRTLWPSWAPHVAARCGSPREWPIAFGLAVQQGMAMAKDVLAPALALSIVMECAIPMAKLDPGEIGIAA